MKLGGEGDLQTLRDHVAVHVMGWHLQSRPWAYSDSADVWHDERNAPLLTQFAWRPDQDDAQNMQVLDRMAALGFNYVVHGTAAGVKVSFSGDAEGVEPSSAPSAAPMGRRVAVLRAALDYVVSA